MATPSGAAAPAMTHRAPGAPRTPSTRLSGRQLQVARVAWGALAGLLVGLYALLLPAYWTQLRTVCRGAHCGLVQPSPAGAAALHRLGLSVAGYAELALTATLLSTLVCLAVAGVIVWRKSDDWMALLVALSEVALGTVLVSGALLSGNSAWQLPTLVVSVLAYAVLFLLAGLFPSGRFVPRWAPWLLAGWAVGRAVTIGAYLAAVSAELQSGAYEVIWLGALAGAVVAQVYRYRVVSDPHERAQTRWVVLGGSAAIGVSIAVVAPKLLVPALGQAGSPYNLASVPIDALAIGLFSLSMGMAILRHRLYDIDLLIRATVIYGLVTGTLAAIYALSSLLLQAGFEAVSGQGSTLAIVGSTLAIGALIQPVRRRVQAAIDRRFYRGKYDAARTVAAFGRLVRSEVDLSHLTQHLLAVVEETMQPSQVSLWLLRRARQDEPGVWQGVGVTEAAAAHVPKPVPLPGLVTVPENP